LGIPPAYLVLLATHNHQGPIQIAADNFDYGRELAEKIFAAFIKPWPAKTATRSCFSAMATGTSRERSAVIARLRAAIAQGDARRQGGGAAVQLSDAPAARPRKLYGASHPGFAMEELEAKYPGAVAIYADGCGGDQYTLAPEGTTDFLAHANTWARAGTGSGRRCRG